MAFIYNFKIKADEGSLLNSYACQGSHDDPLLKLA